MHHRTRVRLATEAVDDGAFEATDLLRAERSGRRGEQKHRERGALHRFTQILITPHRFVNSAGAPFVVGYASMPAMSDGGIELMS